MARGETNQAKLFYKGADEVFAIFLDSVEDYEKWREDKSIPLAQVVSSFKVFTTGKQSTTGLLDGASKSTLENEFGTSVDDDVVLKILEGGTLQEVQMPERQGPKNDSNGVYGTR
ncbi:ribosome maturation protein [Dichotomopilus funicola]|uniref:Ribosome maturation protein n=1 Tax=Dichotomopilus funicola TaxID=1934379 RepID=A0AAN6VA04_9PEZI|nr:ribosome maturation protein [Dichotomopilus funicola]